MATTTTFQRVYVWERPGPALPLGDRGVRAGARRHRAPHRRARRRSSPAGDASASYWFGTVRFLHFASAFVFFFNFVVRIYWGFVGNQYARWYNFFPLTPALLKKQFTRARARCSRSTSCSSQGSPIEVMGHNALAAWTYGLVFLAVLFQIVTGFGAVRGDERRVAAAAVRVDRAADGRRCPVRIWHHSWMWFFIVFSDDPRLPVVFHEYVEAAGRSRRWSADRSSSTGENEKAEGRRQKEEARHGESDARPRHREPADGRRGRGRPRPPRVRAGALARRASRSSTAAPAAFTCSST